MKKYEIFGVLINQPAASGAQRELKTLKEELRSERRKPIGSPSSIISFHGNFLTAQTGQANRWIFGESGALNSPALN